MRPMTLQAGVGLSVNTERELVNHRKLLHPNIIRYGTGCTATLREGSSSDAG